MGKLQKTFLRSPDCEGLEFVLKGEYSIPLKNHPATVLDIGANQGAFTCWARHVWPNCTIHAFEPVPENSIYFKRNFPSDEHVRLEHLAVSTEPNLELRYGKTNLGECSRYDLGYQNGKTIKVDCIHPALLESAEFVKIDTEGCEVEILGHLDLSKTMAISCEYHRMTDIDDLKAIAIGAGFDLVEEMPSSLQTGILKFRKPEAVPTEKNVFLALPVYRNMDIYTVQSLISLVTNQMAGGNFSMVVEMHAGECPIGRARNDLTWNFLQHKECTHILFIDSDIIFSYEQVRRILSHDRDIVGGFYMKKQEGQAAPVCNTLATVMEPDANGLVQVKYMGTGFLCVSRKVFERMIEEKGDELAYTDDSDQKTKHDFWRMGVAIDTKTGKKRWLSEDWQFCQFALDLGFEIWADAGILVKHSGHAIYPLSYQEKQLYTAEQLKRMGLLGESGKTEPLTAGAEAFSPVSTASA